MKWQKPSQELIEHLEQSLQDINFEPKKMFGQYACFLKGHMFSGVFQNDIFLRLAEEDRTQLQKENDEVVPFEPRSGMKMKEYVIIPESIHSDPSAFGRLVAKSAGYASSLPQKRKKK
jgi:TfoX/Sxy family transcriptional regulator of competence genes